MTHHQFLRIKKLTGKAIIQVAAKHNHREIVAEVGAAQGSGIDPSRTGLNILLRGCETASAVAGMAQSLMDNAGVKPLRKDAVRALEVIFSLPPESAIDNRRFFADALQWIEEYFDAPVISAIVHYDEAAPHCHVLLLPLVRGRMIGSDLMGNRSKLLALQADFHEKVGQRYGLARQAAQKRLSAPTRRLAASSALDAIQANLDRLNKPSIKQALLDAIGRDPEPLMMAMNMDMPKPKSIKGTFAGIMTKPCKPERKQKPIGFDETKPIGFAAAVTPEKHQTLSCVGFASFAPPISPAVDQPPDTADDYSRERDTDHTADYWDTERGEFIKVPIKASGKLQAVASVPKALNGKQFTEPKRSRK